MEEALRALLVGYAPLYAVVGERIYWERIPQGAQRPCIVMFRISGAPRYHMAGADNLVGGRVQFDFQAPTVTGTWQLERLVSARLSGIRQVVNGIQFQGAFKLSVQSNADFGRNPQSGAVDPGSYDMRQADYEIWASVVPE